MLKTKQFVQRDELVQHECIFLHEDQHMPLSVQVLSDMNTCMVQMNSHIFTAFLQACTVVPLVAHQVEAVFRAMASYRASQPPTAFVYTSLLTFCAKQAPDRALDVWHAMQEVPLEIL